MAFKNKQYNPIYIVNSILLYFQERNKYITPMKLQKIFYLVCRLYLFKYETWLISNEFKTYSMGPINEVIEKELLDVDSEIEDVLVDDDNQKCYISSKELNLVLKEVIEEYGDKTDNQLSNLTHQPDSPWTVIFKERGLNEIIPIETIYEQIKLQNTSSGI